MASLRLYHVSSFFLRLRPKTPSLSPSCYTSLLFSPPSRPIKFRLLPSPILSRSPLPAIRFYSRSSAAADEAAAADITPSRQWPEWEQFLEKMESMGYFEESSSSGTESAAKREDNRVKHACMKFARERFDIIRCLPKEDIKAVVECGCPGLLRKAVNSAKRLRAFLDLDEETVCSLCILRGSCDRANVKADENEGARTVDVMRILLTYAHPESELPPMKEHVQKSARKLLVELIKLSDTTLDPTLPKPALKLISQAKHSKVISQNNQTKNAEMKKGDWLCPNCSFHNFARNVRCLECKEDGPKRVDFSGMEMKLGDWTCPRCEFMNFSRNKKCFRCQELRPKRELQPGEWECPSCDFLNFRRNMVCLKCNCDRPNNDEGGQFEDHKWRKPREAKANSILEFGDDEDEELPDDEDDEDDDDILPLRVGENNYVVSKRTTPAERRLTSARKQNYPSF